VSAEPAQPAPVMDPREVAGLRLLLEAFDAADLAAAEAEANAGAAARLLAVPNRTEPHS
jgi:hypothetical protein